MFIDPHADGRFRHLMYTLDDKGKRVYTLTKVVGGAVSKSAHPARFSPDDKYSRSVRPSKTDSDSVLTAIQASGYPQEEIWIIANTRRELYVGEPSSLSGC